MGLRSGRSRLRLFAFGQRIFRSDPITGFAGSACSLVGSSWNLFAFPLSGKTEDARYAYLREYLGKRANAGFFCFFQVQAFWIVLFASPFLILVQNPNPLGPLDYLGLAIWLIGFFGLSLADRQLARFKQSPAYPF